MINLFTDIFCEISPASSMCGNFDPNSYIIQSCVALCEGECSATCVEMCSSSCDNNTGYEPPCAGCTSLVAEITCKNCNGACITTCKTTARTK